MGYINFIMKHERGLTSTELINSLSRNLAGEVGGKIPIKMVQTTFIEAYILGDSLKLDLLKFSRSS